MNEREIDLVMLLFLSVSSPYGNEKQKRRGTRQGGKRLEMAHCRRYGELGGGDMIVFYCSHIWGCQT